MEDSPSTVPVTVTLRRSPRIAYAYGDATDRTLFDFFSLARIPRSQPDQSLNSVTSRASDSTTTSIIPSVADSNTLATDTLSLDPEASSDETSVPYQEASQDDEVPKGKRIRTLQESSVSVAQGCVLSSANTAPASVNNPDLHTRLPVAASIGDVLEGVGHSPSHCCPDGRSHVP